MASMFAALPKLIYAVVYYMGHRLRAKVQFEEIERLKNELKQNPNRVLLVMDHKQKVL